MPPVVLLSYRLSGTITDASGKPVQGAYVVSRTNDRDYWVFSEPSNAAGKYSSFFPASDLTEADPVEFAIQAAVGRTSYTTGASNPTFKRRSSATLDLKLPASGVAMPLPDLDAGSRRHLPGPARRRLGRQGRRAAGLGDLARCEGEFQLVLPASVAGKVLRLWQSDFQSYQTTVATPGGPVDLKAWPAALSPRVSRDTAFIRPGSELAALTWPAARCLRYGANMLSGTRIALPTGTCLLALALLLPR